ncbi:MAG: HXXEE domain-containing protein [Deltaproteobacteria bacterium]|nr:HXXEE domain-containing protein [Deltaproteobacteria bacterium]
MHFLRNHWQDIGLGLAIVTAGLLAAFHGSLTHLQLLLWISFITLLLHEFEEYRWPGGFPQFLNGSIFGSDKPNRYPLNTESALVINMFLGWPVYILAALLAEKAVWLGMAAIVVSLSNILAHTMIFNIKAKRFHNPGMITALLLFLPVSIAFFRLIHTHALARPVDYLWGMGLGIFLVAVGILKTLDWMKDKNTSNSF